MINNKYIVICESPFQLINGVEFANTIERKPIFILRYTEYQKNNDQISQLSKRFIPSECKVYNVKIVTKIKSILSLLNLVYMQFIILKLWVSGYRHFAIGNLDSKVISILLWFVPKANKILLDDGTKTLTIQNRFRADFYYNLFTIFSLSPVGKQRIWRNNFHFFQKEILKSDIQKRENSVLLLGTNLVGCNILSEEKYYLLLGKIRDYFKNKEIYYIPHRLEDTFRLKEELGFTIIKVNYPVELFSLEREWIPEYIVSFYSTALYTMDILYKPVNVMIKSFKFDYTQSEDYRDKIEHIYKYYQQKIEVIEIEETDI